jgi:hypothetical protein
MVRWGDDEVASQPKARNRGWRIVGTYHGWSAAVRGLVVVVVIALVAIGTMLMISIMKGQSLTVVPNHTDRATTVPWRWPVPDDAGRMVLGDLVTTPPPAQARPAYPWADALTAARRAGLGARPGQLSRVTLRIGSFLDQFRDRLVWVVEYSHDPMILGGPPSLSVAQRLATINNGLCEFVIAADATRRPPTMLATWQVCWSRGASLIGGVPI